ncbi:hypothetical protein [Saccharopolyspora cebuensis]
MERESGKHGARQDDAMEKELEGMLRGNHPTRAEEFLDAEPPADDDPDAPLAERPERPGSPESSEGSERPESGEEER